MPYHVFVNGEYLHTKEWIPWSDYELDTVACFVGPKEISWYLRKDSTGARWNEIPEDKVPKELKVLASLL